MGAIADMLLAAVLLGAAGQQNASPQSGWAQSPGPFTRVFAACRIVPGVKTGGRPDRWGIDVLFAQIIDALGSHTDADGLINEVVPTLKLYSAPKFGQISADFSYTPNPGFQGTDTAAFSFQVRGRTYLSVHKLIVHIARDERPLPWDCAEAWKMSFR